ncbi:hypothetical protein CK203_028328 [Vitis vinifera]|uniref:Reverse transcriptase Ty1/copia-type domain-containing protein n=1 Tax=Vitis vinifera TaxID=29760 RepID=A0A438J023_VITVI|nr:hypothetical protein CK203_028328 [Vitis vinifera]
MGRLQIEDRRQQEEIEVDPKKEESSLALLPPQQVQGESSQNLIKEWKFVINHPQDQIIEFSKCKHSEFEMSMMGELNFFLGLQIKRLNEGTFINQAKYIRDLLKMFNMEESKTMKTPMSSFIKLDKDEKGKSIDSTMYRGMIERPSTQPSFTEPPQAPLTPDHAPWMDLSAHISSLSTHMEELAIVSDSGSTLWRIAWISIRLASLHNLSISNRGLSILRVAWINIKLVLPHSLSISSRGLSALRIA